jgi:hypothetical protein
MKRRMILMGAGAMGAIMLMAVPAAATGGPCNGRVDVQCGDQTNHGWSCTLYDEALDGCQIGA